MLPGKKFTPEEVLRIAWRRKWLIVLPFVTITLATVLVAWKLPERYRAESCHPHPVATGPRVVRAVHRDNER